jgi:hypothetical protein
MLSKLKGAYHTDLLLKRLSVSLASGGDKRSLAEICYPLFQLANSPLSAVVL